MAYKKSFIYEDSDVQMGKRFGDYKFTMNALRQLTDGRTKVRVIYGNQVINVK